MPNIELNPRKWRNKLLLGALYWALLLGLAVFVALYIDKRYEQAAHGAQSNKRAALQTQLRAERPASPNVAAPAAVSELAAEAVHSYLDSYAAREQLFSELAQIRAQQHKQLDNQQLERLWQQIAANVANKMLAPANGLQLQAWLATRATDPKWQAQSAAAIENFKVEQNQAIAAAERVNAERNRQYQLRQQQLLDEVLRKYPNDPERAATELQPLLDALRSEIYTAKQVAP